LRVEHMRANGGVDYMEIMRLLEHSSVAVTQIYAERVLEDP
jgi:site-specific recombinase XerD